MVPGPGAATASLGSHDSLAPRSSLGLFVSSAQVGWEALRTLPGARTKLTCRLFL